MSKKLIDRPTEIRDDEKLNNSKLFEYLSNVIDLDIESFDILQFPSGYSNLTYLIKSNEKEYVLRKPPHGAKIKSGHDMSREFKVLSSLKEQYHKTPRPIHYCSKSDIIGTDFYLMDRVKGIILRSNNYSQIISDKSQFNFLAEQFVDSFVELHKLDINKIGLTNFGNPDGYNSRQVHGWCKRYNNSKTEELMEMEIVMKWLKSNVSQSKHVSLIHNDFKYDNLVLDENDLSIKAILDWEMCTIGDPFMDLGTSLAYWIQNNDPDFIKGVGLNITMDANNPTRNKILQLYSDKFGKSIKNIVFYFVFGLFKIAVIVQQIFFRYKNGFTKDPRFKNLDQVVKAYLFLAIKSIEKQKIEL
tara:strand:- start:1115 stop:2188 length:1074 start_codon:yes stop_codon:yes gene_type:complete